MATLTDAEKVILRQAVARKAAEAGIPIRWVKACLHDTAQAIEDILSGLSLQNEVSNAIDGASSPYGVTFTAMEKRWITALVMEFKHTRDLLG